ncbi:uncharacterized protein LOC110978308 [Acanthaster planci]|uniref:Uncharacterized protein LOC110978308 n=1 Tax=Acanthaster planci TaxID=133434 RepID=A0A8B7Y8M5_ACAPL|nr:uncharacterized protein LOC110978308 [Acanthaster planci]
MADIDKARIEREVEERRVACRVNEFATQEEFQKMTQDMYADWIKNNGYEKDMLGLGFISHIVVADTASKFVPVKDSRLLDCASGTGLLGEQLKKRGYQHIDALDASQECLDFSRAKQAYSDYFCDFIGENRLPFQDDTYDGICMSAAFGNTHVRPDCFRELLRITKPGGYIIFNVREENFVLDECIKNGKLDDVIHKLAAEGIVAYLEKKRCIYMECKHNDVVEYCFTFVLRKMKVSVK